MEEAKKALKELPLKEPVMLQEFKKFILRGNVVDLAVGVAIGAAFNSVVTSFVASFINPLTGIIPGSGGLAAKEWTIPLTRVQLHYGSFLSVLITFLCTAAVIFFFVVKPINHLMEVARKKKPTPDPTTKKCPECYGEIPIKATRCQFCAIKLPAAAATAAK